MTDVEILRLIEETRKFTAEQHKLIAEASKLIAEANKFKIERWLTPLIVVFGSIGALIAGWSTISALLHAAGIG